MFTNRIITYFYKYNIYLHYLNVIFQVQTFSFRETHNCFALESGFIQTLYKYYPSTLNLQCILYSSYENILYKEIRIKIETTQSPMLL